MSYTINRNYISKGKSRSGAKISKVRFIVAHDTGNPGSSAAGNRSYFQNSQPSASAHTFIDHKEILEIVPIDEKAWHVLYQKPIDNQMFGDDSNDAAIGVELCYGGNIDNKEAYKRYVWYMKYLCDKFGLDPKKHIVGHYTLDPGRKTDPMNAFKLLGITWNDFISDVAGEKVTSTQVKTTTTTSKTSSSSSVLKKGSSGSAVKTLQNKLISKGFSLPKYGADGDYGDETVSAVKALQKAAGIAVDGIYGPATAKALDSYKKPAAKKTTSKASGSAVVPYPGKLIRKGSRGKDVERIQRAVGVKADGIFGSGTESAVKAYQKRKGLSADGIVGPATWNMMF